MLSHETNKFQAWANKGHWTNWTRKPERAADLKFMVWAELTRLHHTERIGTTNLVDRILPGLDDVGRNYVTMGLAHLRKVGELDGCFIRGVKNPRTFGHKSLIWLNPNYNPETAGIEGLEGVL